MQIDITQNKWFLRLGYLLFGSMVFLVLLYMTFPFNRVQEKLVWAFEKESGCQADPKDQSVMIPLRLRWHNVQVVCPNIAPVTLDSIEANVALLPILLRQRGEIDFKIKIAEHGGDLFGTLVVDSTPEGIAFNIKKEGMGLHLNYRGLSGILDMKGVGHWVGQDVLLGAGGLSFSLKDAHVKNQALPWPINDMFFTAMTGKVSWENGVFLVGDFSAEGETATLTSQRGSLILHEPFLESFVSMTLKVLPKGQLKQVATLMVPGYKEKGPILLGITGALNAPKVSINGSKIPTGS